VDTTGAVDDAGGSDVPVNILTAFFDTPLDLPPFFSTPIFVANRMGGS